MVFITGSTGLVGSHLLLELVKKGKDVRALIRPGSSSDEIKRVFAYYEDKNKAEELFSRIEWVLGTLPYADEFSSFLEGVEEIYHCAAMVSFDRKDHEKMMTVNIGGTEAMLQLALEKKVKKFCFVSSVAAIGPMNGNEPVDETSFWKKTRDVSGYSVSKFKSEMEVWRAGAEGLNTVIVNPSVILGPGNWHRGAGRMFTTVDKGMPFYTSGVTGFVDVRDVVNLMTLLMNKNIFGQRFILNSENLSYKEIFRLIANFLGKKSPYLKAGKILSSFGWRMDYLRSLITGTPNILTRETVKASMNRKYYSNKKITEALNYKFIPVAKSIEDVCKVYEKRE
jgi:nucleoside-diphosphate-sugar epimerase